MTTQNTGFKAFSNKTDLINTQANQAPNEQPETPPKPTDKPEQPTGPSEEAPQVK
ncbi:hypothetical protein [Acinetobacter celticus]|uniref:hypothetical protein n=1 Tax=Acinetobacter celticus TaxID=1891224 RepID=UPI001489A531|nr:hypothetical protein [Acinetobacter celticus]